MEITLKSLEFFIKCAKDAGNWGGSPMIGPGSNIDNGPAERGNLTQLKRAGLVETFKDCGDTFMSFTNAGKALASEHGIKI
jgi:hypothetical protein